MGTAGKSIADFFSRSHIVGKLKNHHKGACPLCGGEVLGEELHGGVVGGVLVGVVEGFERQQGGGLCIATVLEGMGDQPVGELGVLGQRRAMQVRADDALVDQALKAVVAVVAGTRDDGRSERRGVCVEQGATSMVLESHKGLG